MEKSPTFVLENVHLPIGDAHFFYSLASIFLFALSMTCDSKEAR